MITKSENIIFGHCRNMLGRLLPHELKTFKFLACTVCTDFRESDKPYQALYNNRQAGNVYESFTNFLTKAGIGGVLLINTLKRAFPDKGYLRCFIRFGVIGTTNTGSAYRLVSPVRTINTANDRLLIPSFTSLNGGVRGGFFFHSLLQLHSLLLITL